MGVKNTASSNLYIIKKTVLRVPISCKDQKYLTWKQFVELCSKIDPGDYVSEFGFIEGVRDALVIQRFAKMILIEQDEWRDC